MKKFLKWALILVLVVTAGSLMGAGYLYFAYPDVGSAPEMEVESTSSQVERGEYLAEHVAVCIDCHSERDWSLFSGPIIEGTRGQGGEIFDHKFGFPGKFTAKNITPHGVGDWSDGELFRLITTGVTKEGEPIFPVMPYPSYGKMATEDVKAIIAYIRTLEPIENEVPPSEADFPMNLIMRTIPEESHPTERPDPSKSLKYGKYMVRIAGCADCHTPKEKGEPVKGKYLAGGFEFDMPDGSVVRSSNLTPHKETGIGNWSKETFIKRFTRFREEEMRNRPVAPGEFQTVMPWTMYAGMKKQDLGAMFDYLRSIEPVNNEVERFSPNGHITSAEK